MAETILVVDDEKPIADILKFHLERDGYQVRVAYDGEDALRSFQSSRPDLVILDLMLPKINGFDVCRQIRDTSGCPILILTAKDSEVDTVLGLELGADDYVTKPFSPRAIVARVKAILRRVKQGTAASQQELSLGPLTVDLSAYEAYKDGRPLHLSAKEFELLRHFLTYPGQVFSREALLKEVWGYDFLGDARTVDVTVRRLREKVEDDPSQPRVILTRRGVGYYAPRT